jgi:hypothetical protein
MMKEREHVEQVFSTAAKITEWEGILVPAFPIHQQTVFPQDFETTKISSKSRLHEGVRKTLRPENDRLKWARKGFEL